jgi:hypothetical protein
MTTLAISKPLRRRAFALYALALVTATHWPGLAIQMPSFSRLDLVVHALAFGVWTTLLVFCGFFGPPSSGRNLARSVMVALAYACVDEVSQGVPILRRTVDGLDLAANGVGIVFATVTLALWARAAWRRATTDN